MPRYLFSAAIRFHPWIGDAFEGGGRGMLVLGNSHYGTAEAYRHDLTTYVVRSYPDVYGRAFFTKLVQALSNCEARDVDMHATFATIAFYNYAQDFAGEHGRVRPAGKVMQDSQDAFWEVAETLKPSHVLVLGNDVWNMFDAGEEQRHFTLNGDDRDAIRYRAGSHRFWALSIYHPAAGFAFKRWVPWVNALRTL